MYYILVGVFIVMTVGTIASFIFGASAVEDMDARLFVPPIKALVEKRQKSKRSYVNRNNVQMEEISMLKR